MERIGGFDFNIARTSDCFGVDRYLLTFHVLYAIRLTIPLCEKLSAK